MPVKDYNADPNLNTQISGINIAEGCAPSGINNAIRQLMADVKDEFEGEEGAVSSLDNTLRAFIAEEVAKLLPLAGGTMTGNINFFSQYAYLTKEGQDGFITICGAKNPTSGGFFRSYGLNYSGENPGAAAMCAVDSDGVNHNAVMKPSGQMTINGSLAVTGEYVHVQQATSGSMYLPAGGTWSYVVISKNSSGGVGTCIASTKAGGTAVWTYNGATVSAGWLIAIRVA